VRGSRQRVVLRAPGANRPAPQNRRTDTPVSPAAPRRRAGRRDAPPEVAGLHAVERVRRHPRHGPGRWAGRLAVRWQRSTLRPSPAARGSPSGLGRSSRRPRIRLAGVADRGRIRDASVVHRRRQRGGRHAEHGDRGRRRGHAKTFGIDPRRGGRRSAADRRMRQHGGWAVAGSPFTVATVTLPIAGSTQVFPVRRIYCIGRNYAAHSREMGRTRHASRRSFSRSRRTPCSRCRWAPSAIIRIRH